MKNGQDKLNYMKCVIKQFLKNRRKKFFDKVYKSYL